MIYIILLYFDYLFTISYTFHLLDVRIYLLILNQCILIKLLKLFLTIILSIYNILIILIII